MFQALWIYNSKEFLFPLFIFGQIKVQPVILFLNSEQVQFLSEEWQKYNMAIAANKTKMCSRKKKHHSTLFLTRVMQFTDLKSFPNDQFL